MLSRQCWSAWVKFDQQFIEQVMASHAPPRKDPLVKGKLQGTWKGGPLKWNAHGRYPEWHLTAQKERKMWKFSTIDAKPCLERCRVSNFRVNDWDINPNVTGWTHCLFFYILYPSWVERGRAQLPVMYHPIIAKPDARRWLQFRWYGIPLGLLHPVLWTLLTKKYRFLREKNKVQCPWDGEVL